MLALSISRKVSNVVSLTSVRAFSNPDHVAAEAKTPELNPLFETAQSALQRSCYLDIKWKIHEDKPVSEAAPRMAGYNIGALGVVNSAGTVVGVFSERDILRKVFLLNNDPANVLVKKTCTTNQNGQLYSVSCGNPIDDCMYKMMRSDVRHVLIRNAKDDPTIVSMISIEDIVKCTMAKNEAQKDRLENIIQYQNLGV
jgi:signal-transduction protein with cAMP-binding, CBS, and nucleotidyltransferase domain